MRTKIFNGDHPLTSPYGWRTLNGKKEFHNGVDFSMPSGTDLIVPDSFNGAKVRLNTKDSFGGIYIQLQRADGKGCYWLHNSKNLLKIGATVKTGDIIAKSGNSGNSTGPHVHFGVQSKATIWASHEDPMPYITLGDNTMKKGDNIEFIENTNIRGGNGLSFEKWATIPKGAVGRIADGPRSADGYTWWDVWFERNDLLNKNYHGWMADVGSNMKVTTKPVTYINGKTKPVDPPEPPIITDPCQDTKDELTKVRLALATSEAQRKQLVVDYEILQKENEDQKKEIEELKPYKEFYNSLAKLITLKNV